jgi:serine/threonine protein kinase
LLDCGSSFPSSLGPILSFIHVPSVLKSRLVSSEVYGGDLDATIRGLDAGQKIFNRYRLTKILGRGGMGIVWLARDEELERDVALKFVPELLVLDRAVLMDLKRETRRSLELTHKNIVRIYDFIHDDFSGAISMEFIDGDTLSNLRADRPSKVFEPAELHDWLDQLCDALNYAHNHVGVVHRDLKPPNLMVNKRDQLKVTDFGIARSLSNSMSMLTQGAGTSGTLLYMSPQQLDGERGSHLDDIYSLGATIYESLTSRPPFYAGNIDRQVREKIPPSMAQRRVELEITGNPIPKNWETTVAACLAKSPTKRPQSISEVANRLQLGTASVDLEPAQRMRLFKPATAVVVALAVLALAILFVRGLRERETPKVNQVSPPEPSPIPAASQNDDVERQRAYLHKMLAQSLDTALNSTPSPKPLAAFSPAIPPFKPSVPIVSHEFDGKWKGADFKLPWTATIVITNGQSATCTEQLTERLRADHWNDVLAPYNRTRTITRRWTAESQRVEPTFSGLNIYWKDWTLQLKPTIPLSALAEKMKTAPSTAWGFTRNGSDLVTGSWTFHRSN